MSTTPMPDFKAGLKTFWQRPEGKTGALFLVATAIAGLYGVSLILPWLIALTENMIELTALAVALFVVLYVLMNKTFRSIVSNVFQMSMRWLTGLVVTIDPIGILDNNIDRMKEKNEELAKGIEGCAGAKRQLENAISKNNQSIEHDKSIIQETDRKSVGVTDPLVKQRLVLQRQTALQDASRKMSSNTNLNRILAQTTKMYTMLTRWQQLAEFNIENAIGQRDNLKEERTTILASYRALGPAKRLIKGDPEELKLVNASLEYLAEDNANKLGAMEDFARYSQKFLDNMDLEQGASAADAEKMLGEFEKKLLTAGSAQIPTSFNNRTPNAVLVPASNQTVEGDYLDSLK